MTAITPKEVSALLHDTHHLFHAHDLLQTHATNDPFLKGISWACVKDPAWKMALSRRLDEQSTEEPLVKAAYDYIFGTGRHLPGNYQKLFEVLTSRRALIVHMHLTMKAFYEELYGFPRERTTHLLEGGVTALNAGEVSRLLRDTPHLLHVHATLHRYVTDPYRKAIERDEENDPAFKRVRERRLKGGGPDHERPNEPDS